MELIILLISYVIHGISVLFIMFGHNRFFISITFSYSTFKAFFVNKLKKRVSITVVDNNIRFFIKYFVANIPETHLYNSFGFSEAKVKL